jgi:hypothetical protein
MQLHVLHIQFLFGDGGAQDQIVRRVRTHPEMTTVRFAGQRDFSF